MKKILIGILTGSLLTAIFLSSFTPLAERDSENSKTQSTFQYPFLAKRIFLENPNDTIVNFIDLREKLKKYVSENSNKIGIYFEYLPTGVSVGVNDREEFYRASLIKLPLIMRAYKMVEVGDIKKDEKLTVRRDLLDISYGELGKNGGGTSITFDEVVNLVLTKSDNTAYNMLLDRVNQSLKESESQSEKGIFEVNDYFDIPQSDSSNEFQLTPKSYSSILKSLYFSSYLEYSYSNEIIDTMTNSVFKDGLPKFIPSEIKIAHKTGIFEANDPKKGVNSDCGIIYYPNRTYLLCIMVGSGDQEKSLAIISEISKIVYEYVSRANQ